MVYIGTLLAEPDACVSLLLILLYINSIISKVTYTVKNFRKYTDKLFQNYP